MLQASESPGGAPGLPAGRSLDMKTVGYNFTGFQDIPPMSVFDYSTRDTTEDSLMVSTDGLVGDLFADNCQNYRGKAHSQNRQEPCKTLEGLIDFW